MKNISIVLHGGGEHARVVLDCLLEQGLKVVGIFDPKFSGSLFGIPYLGNYNPKVHADASLVVSIGDNAIRKAASAKALHPFTTVTHSSSCISSRASIGKGSMLLHRSTVQVNCKIGDHVIVNTGAQIDHDCTIDNFVHIAPGSVLCGNVSVGEGAFIGAGSIIIPGVQIGKWATVGAGSVVIRNVPDHATVVGNPARLRA